MGGRLLVAVTRIPPPNTLWPFGVEQDKDMSRSQTAQGHAAWLRRRGFVTAASCSPDCFPKQAPTGFPHGLAAFHYPRLQVQCGGVSPSHSSTAPPHPPTPTHTHPHMFRNSPNIPPHAARPWLLLPLLLPVHAPGVALSVCLCPDTTARGWGCTSVRTQVR